MFDYKKFNDLKDMLKKAQFVPMDPSMAGGAAGDPAAMGGAGAPPMDPSMGGMPPPGDPAAGGMPMDPSMMGGMPPMDPSMMGGMPPAEGGDVSPSGEPYMKITPTQLSKLFKQFAEVFKSVLGIQSQAPGASTPPPAPAPTVDQSQQLTELNAKLDAILRG